MTSAAAISGIQKHGLKWRKEIHLSVYTSQIGAMSESSFYKRDLALAAHAIARNLHKFIKNNPTDESSHHLEMCDIEYLEHWDLDLEDVRTVLSEIYDVLDYYRILVV